MAEIGFTLEQVAGFLLRYSKRQNVVDPAARAPGEEDDRLFAAAFPASAFEGTLPLPGQARAGMSRALQSPHAPNPRSAARR
jgi:hypothetical protein